jgi:hypothetical protein
MTARHTITTARVMSALSASARAGIRRTGFGAGSAQAPGNLPRYRGQHRAAGPLAEYLLSGYKSVMTAALAGGTS